MLNRLNKVSFAITIFCICSLTACKSKNDEEGKLLIDRSLPVTAVKPISQPLVIKEHSIGFAITRADSVIKAQTSGKIYKLLVDVGAPVEKSKVLVLIEQDEQKNNLSMQNAQLKQVDSQISYTDRSLKRYSSLAKEGFVAKSFLDDLQTKLNSLKAQREGILSANNQAKLLLKRTQVIAPFSGFISDRFVGEGEYVSQGAPLFKISNNAILQAVFPFPEIVLNKIKVGQKIYISTLSDKNHKIEASISSINPNVNPQSRSFSVYIEFKNIYNWPPGIDLYGEPVIEVLENALFLPDECIVQRPKSKVVYLINNEKVIESPVEVGNSYSGITHIKSGLNFEDLVAKDGAYYLTDGAKVAVKQEKD